MVRGRKVKEEEKDEVVEMEVEEVGEEKVKGEVEEKVVEEKAEGGRRVAGAFFWRLGAGGRHGPALEPRRPGWPPAPKTSTTPLGRPGESDLDSPFFEAPGASQNFAAGEVGVGG